MRGAHFERDCSAYDHADRFFVESILRPRAVVIVHRRVGRALVVVLVLLPGQPHEIDLRLLGAERDQPRPELQAGGHEFLAGVGEALLLAVGIEFRVEVAEIGGEPLVQVLRPAVEPQCDLAAQFFRAVFGGPFRDAGGAAREAVLFFFIFPFFVGALLVRIGGFLVVERPKVQGLGVVRQSIP